MDHLRHFQVSEDPFRSDHLEKFQVEVPSQADAWRRVDRGVRQGKGLIVLSGAVGTGKTSVARQLYQELEEEVFEAAMLVVLRGRVDAGWLFARFAVQLGVEDVADEREALIGQIYERLAIIREDGRHAVLIIDDAHALAAPETLVDVCGLVKLEYEDRTLLSVVLAGGPALLETLASDSQLAHRVDVRVELAPFTREECAGYLAHRVQTAGGNPKLLLPGAVASLHDLSGGAPGRMNTLADNALYEAFLAGRSEVARSDVEKACADLGWIDAVPPASQEEPARRARIPREAASTLRPVAVSAEVTAPDPRGLSDLDSELEAVFENTGAAMAEGQQTMLMDFESTGAPAASHRPLPPEAAAAPTEIQLEPTDSLEAPPKEGDEVDDLFMELLED